MSDIIECKVCHKQVNELRNAIAMCECGNVVMNGITRTIEAKTADSYTWIFQEIKLDPEYMSKNEPEEIRKDRLQLIDTMIASYESLPPHAMLQPATCYDLLSVLLLLKSVLRDDLTSAN